MHDRSSNSDPRTPLLQRGGRPSRAASNPRGITDAALVRTLLALGTTLFLFALVACEEAPDADAGTPDETAADVMEFSTQYHDVEVTRIASGLENPWAIAFVGDDRVLVSERPGRVQLIENGERTEVDGVPQVHAQNQGGMLDLVPHPDFDENGWVYMTWSKEDSDGTVPALGRARLEGAAFVDFEELFESNTPTSPGRHYGSRILFLDDGTLLMTIGDRGADPERAQDTQDHSGTVVRLNDDGTIPDDNPFVGEDGYAPEIWSYGHRNIQGIILHPETGEVWATEHGPRGGDELNRMEPGVNYGWPAASLGREYGSQEPFSEDRHLPDMEDPVWEFLPTLAPSGLAVVSGGFENWEGDLLAGGLGAERILRVVLEAGEVVHIEELFTHEFGRIREVRQAPDGSIWFAVDASDGAVYRMVATD